MTVADDLAMPIESRRSTESNILAIDLAFEHVCQMLNYMDSNGFTQFCPRWDPAVGEHVPFTTSWWMPEHDPGYYARMPDGALPGHGAKHPWLRRTDPLIDVALFATSRFDDGHMEFD